jgi:hypothetical protein
LGAAEAALMLMAQARAMIVDVVKATRIVMLLGENQSSQRARLSIVP